MHIPRESVVVRALLVLAMAACGGGNGSGDGGPGGDGQTGGDGGQCVGLQCFQVDCAGGGTTSVSGTVYAPNGTLPLHNVTVYVPNAPVGALPDTLQCDRCGSTLSGNPLVQATTDTMGRFTLTNMPATADVPLVIQVGKWRRQVVVNDVPACTDTALVATDTRLPRTQAEGDIPRMALSTGGADALECLLRKIGIADSEFTTAGGAGRVHLYAGSGGTDELDAALGGGTLAAASTLWADQASLSAYDVVFLSCEGRQDSGNKPDGSLAAMKAYTDVGGRVFTSHWHNYWLQAGPDPWPSLFTFDFQEDLRNIEADIDTSFERGASLAEWLLNVGGSTVLGKIDLTSTQHTLQAVDQTRAERWIYKDDTANGTPSVQYLSFTTPVEALQTDRCGRAVFSDIHVASGDESSSDLSFPAGGCTSDIATLSPQEKVLAFMIFDIASCVGPTID